MEMKQSKTKKNKSNKSTGKNAAVGKMTVSTSNTGMSIRNLPMFPSRTLRTHQYFSTGSVITGTATANAYVYSTNGLFDPDVTSTGGQPMGFDQMIAFYNHYSVLRSRIRVLISNTSSVLTPSVSIVLSGSPNVTSSIEQLVENGDLTLCQLTYAGTFGSVARLSHSINCGTFQGVSNVMDVTDMSGDAASNPAEQSFFHIAVWNPYSPAQVTLNFQVILEFDTMWHEPRKGPLS